MTEAEALKRWCPFARVWHCDGEHGGEPGVAINRFASEHDPVRDTNARCIGSACMAWRVDKTEFNKRYVQSYEEQSVRPDDVPADWHFVDRQPGALAYWEPPSGAHGFCGLAGKPAITGRQK